MLSAISEARLGEIYPGLAEKVRQLAEMLEQENIVIQITQSFRPWAVQESLYAQGRTTPGSVVTNAKPGYSWHNFGLAIDVAPFANAIPDWDINHPTWARICAVGISLGLTSGSEWRTFPDWPHLQLTGTFGVSPDDNTRYLFKEGGLAAVWKEAFPGASLAT